MPKKIAGSEARKANLNMRTTQALRSRLEAAAAASGRALAHEVEYRLERSFELVDLEHLADKAAERAVERFAAIEEGDEVTPVLSRGKEARAAVVAAVKDAITGVESDLRASIEDDEDARAHALTAIIENLSKVFREHLPPIPKNVSVRRREQAGVAPASEVTGKETSVVKSR